MQESPIFSKTYDFLRWLLPATAKFPREQRFILARFIQEVALRFQECLIEAGVGYGRMRISALARADVELTKLRFYLRLCRDMNLLKLNQYRHAAEMVAEIGRLLGGWRKSVGQKE
jgi:cytosine/adenosine deaminase-related metal-dependent hydrolase